ncbi:MAG: Gfo/Idh/MocA family oxidoreductase [Actinobacteria bacterium]|nr:Gfo/Idh/MocA family oxidoreductase [Actinomycetota bacterium]
MPTRTRSISGFSTDTATVGVGMLGYGYMGDVHSEAYRRIAQAGAEPTPTLVTISGRSAERTAAAATEYGFETHAAAWRDVVEDDRVTLFDNVAPNSWHAEPTIAAAEAGKHVLCEKPLGRTADESREIWQRVAATGVTHMCGFNYRFVPAIRQARELIASGELGEIRHVRGRYLQEWLVDPGVPADWRTQAETAGAGAVADLGVHVVDLVRYLVGEPGAVSATARTFTRERPGGTVDVDDAFAATLELEGGAIGTLEASRVARGRNDDLRWEVSGSRASLAFRLDRLEELAVSDGAAGSGFRAVPVPGPDGEAVEWRDTFVYELRHLLAAIAGGSGVGPVGATLEDGYRADVVCAAILTSARTGERQEVRYG